MRKLYYIAMQNYKDDRSPNLAHHALLVKHPKNEEFAKLIQVSGGSVMGYYYEFQRNWRVSDIPGRYELYLIGEVEDRCVEDGYSPNKTKSPIVDDEPKDVIERAAKTIDKPGIFTPEDLNKAIDDAVNGRPFRSGWYTSQEWTRDLVKLLVRMRLLTDSAMEEIEKARRFFCT